MRSTWRINLLGTFSATRQRWVVAHFRTRKAADLLATLCLERRTRAREELIELFWPGSSAGQGRQSLSQALSALRHRLEPPGVLSGSVIQATRNEIGLVPTAVETDVAEFKSLLASSREGRGTDRMMIERAIALYGGDLVPGSYAENILAERDRLRTLFISALLTISQYCRSEGRRDQALDHVLRAIEVDPFRDEAIRLAIELQIERGHSQEAVRLFRGFESRLLNELGATPDRSLLELVRPFLAKPATSAAPTATTTRQPSELKAGGSLPRPAVPLPAPITLLLVGRRASEETGRPPPAGVLAQITHPDAHVFAFARPARAVLNAFQRDSKKVGLSVPEMALWTGEARSLEAAHLERLLERALPLLQAAHAGQILCAESTASLLKDEPEGGFQLVDLGLFELRRGQPPQHVFDLRRPDATQRRFPPPKARPARAGRLPARTTRFFGREREFPRLETLLSESRLVTLTGTGGTGKTRLAVEAAGLLASSFPGGVWFVELADVADPGRVGAQVVRALGLQADPGSDPMDRVCDFLAEAPVLLVLDNFEHLVDTGAEFVDALLKRSASVKCLVTSRRKLLLNSEREFPVQPLDVPGDIESHDVMLTSPSIQLFIDRSRAVRPDLELTEAAVKDVARICTRLEGIPLAIELAAARCQVLSPAQVLKRLTRRLDFLVTDRPDVPRRQRTLRATIDWSLKLLSPAARRLFQELSVFPTSFDIESAEVVCAEPLVLDHIEHLRECSLLVVAGPEPLFRMLDTVREHVWESVAVGRARKLKERHARHYAARVRRLSNSFRGRDEVAVLDATFSDYANLNQALKTLVETGFQDDARSMALRLGRYWLLRGPLADGRQWLESLLPKQHGHERARVLGQLGELLTAQGDYDEAQRILEEAETEGDATTRAESILGRAQLAYFHTDLSGSFSLYEEARTQCSELGLRHREADAILGLGRIATARQDHKIAIENLEASHERYCQLEDRLGQSHALSYMAMIAGDRSDLDRSEELWRQVLHLRQAVGDTRGAARAMTNLGLVAIFRREYEAARLLVEQSLSLLRETGDRRGIADGLANLGYIERYLGRLGAARVHLLDSLAIRLALREARGVILCLEGLADIFVEEGDHETGARLYGAAEAARTALSWPRPENECEERNRLVATMTVALGESTLRSIWKSGESQDVESLGRDLLSKRPRIPPHDR